MKNTNTKKTSKSTLALLNKIAKRENKPTLKETLYRNRGKVTVCKDYKPSATRTIKVKSGGNSYNDRKFQKLSKV